MTNNYRKSSLIPKSRVVFDPSNTNHMLDFAKFVRYNGWKEGCNYYLEDPFTDIPTMIYSKIATHTLQRYMGKI